MTTLPVGAAARTRETIVMFGFAILLAATATSAATIRIEPLKLPPSWSIDPATIRFSVNARGDIAASVIRKPADTTGIYVWYADGSVRPLPAPPVASGDISARLELGSIGPHGEIYAAVIRMTEGARMVQSESDVVYTGSIAKPFSPGCARGDASPSFANADGTLGYTFEASPDDVTPDNMQDGSFAPDAFLVRGAHCVALGKAYVTAARGEYVAGYRGYLNATSRVLGPSVVNTDSQYYVAMRWFDLEPRELGAGVALDVASDGTCVGADALPYLRPHALQWDPSGRSHRLVTGDAESAAYAIDEHGRTVGTLVDAETKARYAFLDTNGTVRRLDDIARNPHWRMLYAYRILESGAIVGVGTHDGVPTPFVVSGIGT